MLSDYAIHIRDKSGQYRQRLTEIESIEIIEALNDAGSWMIKSKTAYPCPLTAGDGIVISREGSLYYSGVLKSIDEEYDAYERLYTWTASGASDLDYLTRRVCFPDPATGLTSQVSHYEDTGTLAAVVKRLIDKNLGPEAMPARQEPLVALGVVGDLGTSISVSLRFQNLMEAIKPYLDDQMFSIRANWSNADRTITYQIYSSNNYNQVLLFTTELNQIRSMTFNSSVPEGNAIISGGQGEGTERSFAYATDDDSVAAWGRVEYFHDMRAVDSASLQSDADSTLQQRAAENTGYSSEMAGDRYNQRYKEAWNIGDFVAVGLHGSISIQRVLQVKTRVTYDEEVIEPTLGTIRQGKFALLFDRLQSLRSDVNQLQWSTN